MKDTQPRVRKALWFPETAGVILIHDNLNNFKKCQSNESCANGTEELRAFYKLKEHPRGVGRAGDIGQERCWTARLLEYKRINNTKPVNSDPCLGSQNTRSTIKCLKNQRNMYSEIHVRNKGLPNRNLLNVPIVSKIVCKKIAERKGREFIQKNNVCEKNTSIMDMSPKLENTMHSLSFYTLWNPYFGTSSSLEQITKEPNGNRFIQPINVTVEERFRDIYLKRNTVTWKDGAKTYRHVSPIRPELATKILRSKVSIKPKDSHIISNSIVPAAEDCEMQLQRQSSFPTLKVLFGPYAQIHFVYNVGTSQQFKQRTLGVGSSSISGNDSSSAPSKRRAIRIESGVSFSIEFTDRGKSSGSETPPTPATSPSVAETKSKKDKSKTDLHRCLCTLSFPTDDKKLKNKPCDSGVCVPGKCTPSECFKRLQEKYGSKKKSASDVSSSQASQTGKKLERAGKETVVKEKGSSSISKYQESTEVKPLPVKPKFDIIKTTKDCCNKFCKSVQFWKKDKGIALKPAVIGTDISVKGDDKSFGTNAATQSGKIKGKADKGAAGDKKATQKGKKEKKDEKKPEKKDEKKDDKKAGKKAEKKGKEGEKKGKEGEKKGKEGEKKVSKKKDKKGAEVKKETKETGVKTVKGRPIKSYECEPGVCTPKVCSPKECYERKFPPPPPPKLTTFSTIQNCLRKMCCRKPLTGSPQQEQTGISAATQARGAAPEVAPGTPVYKATGSSPRERVKPAFATTAQPPIEGGDIRTNKKQTAYSGIQFYQTTDNDTMVQRQGVNIGSECSCQLEFFKMMY